ncbi:MAG TPA: acetate kinase [Candidatus Binatia bacterium]|jgi:acetate kinase|nr:acetate kinase [Candidatus Binatia bacterium]
MNILVLNCGSSSIKFQLIETAGDLAAITQDRKMIVGLLDRLGEDATFKLKAGDAVTPKEQKIAAPDHEVGVREIIQRLDLTMPGSSGVRRIDAIAHRVVHGGDLFTEAAVIDEKTLARIESLDDLAPLHNPAAVSGIHAARKIFRSTVPMTAVFDTAFHHTIPETAATYAIPYDLAAKHRIRRYGFHGMAHQYSMLRYAALSGVSPERVKLVTLHLGNGCSACAIRDGRSVETSMGFTPLEGLVMGTRSGDLDPALVSFLARKENVDAAEVERWLNQRSGLLGLSGRSNDMRELLSRYENDQRARLAIDVFCYRARKYLGAYLAALGGAQAIVFSGGIGENAPAIRESICREMAWCGLRLDTERNNAAIAVAAAIAAPDARIGVHVIPSDEEAIIAAETACLLSK